jgi:hypothetical protein
VQKLSYPNTSISYKMTFKEIINENIRKYGHHVTTIISDLEPRYSYTIGLSETLGFELIFAGGIYFMHEQVVEIINEIADRLKVSPGENACQTINFGLFTLNKVNQTWSSLMVLGVFDYYQRKDIEVLQIVPDPDHYTMDIPTMTKEFAELSEPVWKWLTKEWDYPVSKKATVTINIDAIQGKKITEVVRWEADEWEGFVGSGDEVNQDDIRVVSLAIRLGIDDSLLPILNLEIGKGFWRDANELQWQQWGQ